MNEQQRENLSDYRLESAEEHLRASKLLLDRGFLKDSIESGESGLKDLY